VKFVAKASRLNGTVRAPPSKSYTHRAVLMSALSGGPCRVGHPLLSEDTEASVAGIEALGAAVARDNDSLRIVCGELHASKTEIDARNSGTTLRLLTGIAALLRAPTVLTGDASLRRRPILPLLRALERLGARSKALGPGGRPPVEIRGPLVGGRTTIPGSVSSQFLSSLLLVCPLAERETVLRVTPPIVSEPYVEMTRFMLRRFDVLADAVDGNFEIPGHQVYRPVDFEVPGDLSSAAMPLTAAAVSGGDVTVEAIDLSLPQGDTRIVNLLGSFGARVTSSENRVRVRADELSGQRIDIGDTPDLFPVLAVLATQARGETRFVNGAHLHLKESDRIATTVTFLKAMGANARATPDGCVIVGPSKLRGAAVVSQGDHRILMAAAVAALAASGPVEITDPWCFRVSYPTFLDDFRSLGADMAVAP
jgi:3-phosphoshikimate 1-carboxyvinyltransferase